MSQAERMFVGSDCAFAEKAAAILLAQARESESGLDLSEWLVVTPGARASRLLLAALLEQAAVLGKGLDPPRMTTPGGMIEALMRPAPEALALARPIERRLAWRAALGELDEDSGALLGLAPRGGDAWTPWRVARELIDAEDALAAGDRSWSEAARAMAGLGGDSSRLEAIALPARRAAALLAEQGLAAPPEYRAELIRRGEARCAHVALVGLFDVGAVQERGLDTVERLLVLIASEPEFAERFDALGRPLEAWIEASSSLGDDAVRLADTPRDQAGLALEFLAEAAAEGALACDDAAIGLADPSLAPALALAARDVGIEMHDAAGLSLDRTSFGRGLAALERILREGHPEDWASALRHPLIEELARAEADADVVAEFDRLRRRHLPASFDPTEAAGQERDPSVAGAIAAIEGVLRPLAGGAAGLPEVIDRLAAIGEPEPEIVERFRALAEELAAAPHELEGSEALRLLLEEAATISLPAQPRERAIEMLGWLELLFEPAPNLIVLGCNEGSLPSGGTDSLLPEALRRKLGLATVASRARRDAVILETLVRRSARVRFVAGRRGAEGEPSAPSRLLLARSGRELVTRVRLLCESSGIVRFAPRLSAQVAATSGFRVPEPEESVRSIESMSVTDFRRFIASPLRWWLERVEKLEAVTDDLREIPLPDLGNVVHAALEELARAGELDAARDGTRLARLVHDRIEIAFRRIYGERPLPAVRMQFAALERRIGAFAERQVESAAAGWRVREVEFALPEETRLTPEGVEPMRLRGRVDRIDFHPARRAWRIIDYKTSDHGDSPRKSHRASNSPDEWIDLQLPLYRYALAGHLRGIEAETSIETGFVRLCADLRDVGWIAADFEPEELGAALAKAEEVVRMIRAGAFDHGKAIGHDDPFAAILQVPVFGRGAEEEGEDSA